MIALIIEYEQPSISPGILLNVISKRSSLLPVIAALFGSLEKNEVGVRSFLGGVYV